MYATKHKVITIGGATQDTFITYDNPHMMSLPTPDGGNRSFIMLEEGCKIEIQKLEHHTGGGATNSAVAFHRLGFIASPVFKVGNDRAADFILKDLKNEGVDLSHIVRDVDHETGTAFIIPSPTGDRTVLVWRGANCYLKKSELPLEEIGSSDIVYITSLNDQSAQLLTPIVQQAKTGKALVAINPGSNLLTINFSEFKNALKNIDMVLMNSSEAFQCMASFIDLKAQIIKKPYGSTKLTTNGFLNAPQLLQKEFYYHETYFNLGDFFITLFNQGPRIVVVTDGAHGAYVADKDQIYFHPSLPVTIANTLGAGDAFSSCFVASYTQGKSLQESLVRGALNSSSVISNIGAKTGLLTLNELDNKYNTIKTTEVQTFSL